MTFWKCNVVSWEELFPVFQRHQVSLHFFKPHPVTLSHSRRPQSSATQLWDLISCIFKEMLSTSSYYPETGGSKLIQNICNYLTVYMVPYRKQSPSSLIMLQKPQTHIVLCFWMWALNHKNNDAERFRVHNMMVSVTTRWSPSHFPRNKT
jgi:hypothetical protein